MVKFSPPTSVPETCHMCSPSSCTPTTFVCYGGYNFNEGGRSSTEQRLEHEFHVCLSSTAERLHFTNKSGLTSRKHQRWWSHLFWTTAQWRGKRRREERAFSAYKMETPLWPDWAPAWVTKFLHGSPLFLIVHWQDALNLGKFWIIWRTHRLGSTDLKQGWNRQMVPSRPQLSCTKRDPGPPDGPQVFRHSDLCPLTSRSSKHHLSLGFSKLLTEDKCLNVAGDFPD